METIRLATPEVTPAATTTDYRVADVVLDWRRDRIRLRLVGDHGERKEIEFRDTRTLTMLRRIVKRVRNEDGSVSNVSLRAWLMQQAIADGHLQGTVAGSEDE